jgi:hypothetical protein
MVEPNRPQKTINYNIFMFLMLVAKRSDFCRNQLVIIIHTDFVFYEVGTEYFM